MIYFPERKFAFVHIPKTAGKSITDWLINTKENIITTDIHDSIHIMRKSCDIQSYFTVVRNPWERLVSNYFCFKNFPQVWSINGVTGEFPSFQKLMQRLSQDVWMNENFKWWFTTENNQVDWIDEHANVLRYETLAEDFKQIQEYFNIEKQLPTLNTSNHKHYREYYDDELKNMVAKVFEKDIDTFKYTF